MRGLPAHVSSVLRLSFCAHLTVCGLVAGQSRSAPSTQSPKNSSESLRVALKVRSESWIANAGFDQPAFERLCASSNVSVVTDSRVDGIVVIDYREAEGSTYVGGGRGTNIQYALSLISPQDGRSIITLKSAASTPSAVRVGQSLHSAARDVFAQSPVYRLSCSVVAAALGSRPEAEKLLPWAVTDREGLRVLEAIQFAANSPREQAYFAVAKRQFFDLGKVGAVAADPLITFIEFYYHEPRAFGSEGCYGSREEMRSVGAAATVLAETGDQRATKVLEKLLESCQTFISDTVEPAVIPALVALGKIGNVFSLNVLEGWVIRKDKQGGVNDISTTASNKRVGEAATSAANAIRARLVKGQ